MQRWQGALLVSVSFAAVATGSFDAMAMPQGGMPVGGFDPMWWSRTVGATQQVCPPQARASYSPLLSPLQLEVFESHAFGALIGNTALTAAAACLASAASVSGQRQLPVADLPALVFVALLQGTSAAVLDLLLDAPHALLSAAGWVGLLYCLAVPLLMRRHKPAPSF
eukprot:TRINITY_DN613_c0_g1_i1.p3 TRINITY_DN613_c0_g1~~TRINITY_DN613_c0_g1_i1.p3  ORF type:complete len:167 (+),score=36.77 TRINITY_DN613_c0_g1_i1:59-559(+)